jgi:hypothetical protein
MRCVRDDLQHCNIVLCPPSFTKNVPEGGKEGANIQISYNSPTSGGQWSLQRAEGTWTGQLCHALFSE